MPVLADRQYSLDGVLFGKRTPIIVVGNDIGTNEWTVQDQPNPVGPGGYVGTDYLRASTWSFELATDAKTREGATAIVDELAKVWQTAANPETPGSLAELTYCMNGRTRMVYGRPRRFSPVLSTTGYNTGLIPIIADFKITDPAYYDAEPRSLRVNMVTTSEGGWVWPIVWPVTLAPSGERQGALEDVGGATPTPVTIVIHGPVSQPWVSGDGWRIELSTDVAYDQTVTITTRPGAYSVLRNDGASIAGDLTRSSRLDEARLSPGSTELTYGGIDPTNSSYAEFIWHPAHYSI